jgi:hypothetical protein
MSSLNRIQLLTLFKDNLIKFLDALIELLPQEGDLYMLRVMFESQIPIEKSMQTFSQRIIPYGSFITNRDERFFLECTDLFAGVRKDKVSYFKDLWSSNSLSPDDKEALWDWFRLFLKLALQYEKISA